MDWSILGAAREESELQEQSYCAEQKRLMEVSEKDELEIDFDDFESTEEMLAAKVCEILQRPVKERRVATEIDELLSAVIPRAKRNKAKHEKRLLAEREMTWQVREVLRVKFRYMSKQEVLNSLKMSSSKGRKVEASNNGAGPEDKEKVVKKKEIGNKGKSAKGNKKKTNKKFEQLSEKKKDKLRAMFKAMLEKKKSQLQKSDLSAEERAAVKEKCIQKAKRKLFRRAEKKAKADKDRQAARNKKVKENTKRLAELLAKNGIKKPKHEDNQGSDGKKDNGGDRFVHELEGEFVRVTREQAGELIYGNEGKVIETVCEDGVKVCFSKYLAPKTVRVSYLTEVPEKVKKDLCLSFWKVTQFRRKLKMEVLGRLRLVDGGDGGCDGLEVVKDKQEEILQQHIEIGFEWLRLLWISRR